jgi:hypothetical protein
MFKVHKNDNCRLIHGYAGHERFFPFGTGVFGFTSGKESKNSGYLMVYPVTRLQGKPGRQWLFNNE